MVLYPHININEENHLTIGGLDTVELAREFGTPAYIIDADAIRARCREYRDAARKYFGEDALPLYASKALSFSAMYKIVDEEGLGADCVSGGELFTALNAGFPAKKLYFHGNNKPYREICEALDAGVGCFVVDNREELETVDREAGKRGKIQKILLRITPGIDTHTHKAVSTGRVDSKFGSAIATGKAEEMVRLAIGKKNICLVGLHCHIGSQIFDIEPFTEEGFVMTSFMAEMEKKYGISLPELNLGGGLGVPYTEHDRAVNYTEAIAKMSAIISELCERNGIKMPRIILEPGRSLVAAAGVTLYTVGSVKEIPGFKTYVSVDGGMTDNPRYALYQSRYTACIANRADDEKTERVTVAGRCCESGDLIGEDMPLQKSEAGDILAVLTTGAYNYSMASNYNRVPRPPVVLVENGRARLAVRRESYADLVKNDIL